MLWKVLNYLILLISKDALLLTNHEFNLNFLLRERFSIILKSSGFESIEIKNIPTPIKL